MAKLIAGSSPARYFPEVRRLGGRRDGEVNRRVESGAVLRDFDERVFETGEVYEVLEVVRIFKNVAGAHKIPAGLQFGQRVVLLVLLYEPEPELPDEVGPGREGEGNFCGLAFRPALRCVFRHIGHGKMHSLFLRGCAVHQETLRDEPDVRLDGVQEGPALRAIAVENEGGVRSED